VLGIPDHKRFAIRHPSYGLCFLVLAARSCTDPFDVHDEHHHLEGSGGVIRRKCPFLNLHTHTQIKRFSSLTFSGNVSEFPFCFTYAGSLSISIPSVKNNRKARLLPFVLEPSGGSLWY